jgi:hypothetical protein
MSVRRFRIFSFIVLFVLLCISSVSAILPDDPNPVSGMMAALFILAVLLTLACILATVWGAVVAGIFLLLEHLPMPRVRAAIPPVVLVLIAGAALAGTWGRHSMPFLVSFLYSAMAVLMPWPVVASRIEVGARRRPWVLVLVAALTTILLDKNAFHFFPYVSGPGGVPYFFPGQQDMFLEIGELVCIACFVWVLMLLLSYLEEGERVFLAAPAIALAWLIPAGVMSSIFPEGAFIASGVAAVLLLAAAPLLGRRRVWALLLVVAAALVVAGGHPLLLTPGGEWAELSVALFIVLMIAFGTAVGILLVPPGELPWCMGVVFAAPLLVTLVYRLVGGNRWEIWDHVGASVPSLLLLGAVSVVAAAAVGGLVKWARGRSAKGAAAG